MSRFRSDIGEHVPCQCRAATHRHYLFLLNTLGLTMIGCFSVSACVQGSNIGTNGRPISFKVLPILPLVIPFGSLVTIGADDNQWSHSGHRVVSLSKTYSPPPQKKKKKKSTGNTQEKVVPSQHD